MSNLDDNGSITDPYKNFIALSRYARWIDSEGRRETWSESVDRVMAFFEKDLRERMGYNVPQQDIEDIRELIKNHEVMPSMRVMMTAGPALERNHIAAYNCSYLPVDDLRAFDETLLILMQGTGLGFSVAQRHVEKLPPVADSLAEVPVVIVVEDSKEGWAVAYRELIESLWQGVIPAFDVTKVRPAGARLKTFGGRASGPEPLLDLFDHTIKIVKNAAGRKLKPIEAHSIMNKIADVVVVGGVRRSALISLSDLDDAEMAAAKTGDWWVENPHYALSNNSAIYYRRPLAADFWKEWNNLRYSGTGERGIFNLEASKNQANKNGRRDGGLIDGTNPCSEILLRANEFCNLTEVVVRPEDSLIDLMKKVQAATILGTWQSSLTNIGYLRDIWKQNIEEERLLGVSLTGQLGHDVLSGNEGKEALIEWLDTLKDTAISTNRTEADALGIPRSAAITCVKPSGTVSQLVGVSSGMHAWHNDYYIRTVRGDNKDPITQFMKDAGIPAEPCVRKPNDTTVFSFPQKAPEGSILRTDLTAIEHLELWLTYQRYWCEHKPSITISVKEHEWDEVGQWVWEHFDECSGISFLPFSEHTYEQAPYQDCSKEEYEKMLAQMPGDIDWSDLSFYEIDDSNVSGTQELACAGSNGAGCEVIDITSNN